MAAPHAQNFNDVVSMYQTLIKEWNRKPVDLEKCGKLLSGMKVGNSDSVKLVNQEYLCDL